MTPDLHQKLIPPPLFHLLLRPLALQISFIHFQKAPPKEKCNAQIQYGGKKKRGCGFYVVVPLFLCSERNVGKGRREGSLAIEQRNNNTRTRTFRQKKKTNHVFHSGDGELNGGRDRNFTSLSLSPALATRKLCASASTLWDRSI